MKKYLLGTAIAIAVCGCSEAPTKKAPVVEWANGITTIYPNLQSNEISKQSVRDSVKAYAESFVGRPATLFEDVLFRFDKMIDRGDSAAVVFESAYLYSEIEHKAGDYKYVITDINIRVVGKLDRSNAGSLDKDKRYHIKGTVHAWDEKDPFMYFSEVDHAPFDLGTFSMKDDFEVIEAEEE